MSFNQKKELDIFIWYYMVDGLQEIIEGLAKGQLHFAEDDVDKSKSEELCFWCHLRILGSRAEIGMKKAVMVTEEPIGQCQLRRAQAPLFYWVGCWKSW